VFTDGERLGVRGSHIRRLAICCVIDRLDPVLVSGHLAWSTHGTKYLNDLLPLPYTPETLELVARQLIDVEQGLGRPYLVENPASYLGFAGSTMSEVAFLGALVERTGSSLLCDVSNIHLSSQNLGFDPYAYIDALPAVAVRELHLGGFTVEPEEDDRAREVLIDTHAAPIAEPAWELYAYALRRFGPKPTLIEWDNELPCFSTLLAEAHRAEAVARRALAREGRYACTH
jgi:uncharacterized protein (UPF0276 family)